MPFLRYGNSTQRPWRCRFSELRSTKPGTQGHSTCHRTQACAELDPAHSTMLQPQTRAGLTTRENIFNEARTAGENQGRPAHGRVTRANPSATPRKPTRRSPAPTATRVIPAPSVLRSPRTPRGRGRPGRPSAGEDVEAGAVSPACRGLSRACTWLAARTPGQFGQLVCPARHSTASARRRLCGECKFPSARIVTAQP